MKKYIGLLLVALLGQTLPAQKAANPLALLPSDPMAVLQFDGLAAMRKSFAKTQLAQLFQSAEMAQMIEPFLGKSRKELTELLQKEGLDYSVIEEGILAYGGRVTVGFGIKMKKVPYKGVIGIGGGGGRHMKKASLPVSYEPDFWVAVIISPDQGKTDLESLCTNIDQLLEDTTSSEKGTMEIEGHTFKTSIPPASTDTPKMAATWPTMIKGNLTFYLSTDLEKNLAHMLSPTARNTLEWHQDPEKEGIHFLFRTEKFVSLLKKLAMEDSLFMETVMVKKISSLFKISGFANLQDATLSITPADNFIKMKMVLGVGEGEMGFLTCITTPGKKPGLLDLLPLDQGSCSAGYFNINDAYTVLRKCVGLFAEDMEMTPTDLEDQFEKLCKVRLKEDIIDALGNEVVGFQLPLVNTESTTEETPMFGGAPFNGGINGTCLGIEVKDQTGLTRSINKLLRSRGLHVSLRRKEYRDMTIMSLRPFGIIPLEYTITNRLFLVSFGPNGGDAIRTVLDTIADRKAGKSAPSLDKVTGGRLAFLTENWHSIGITRLADSFQSIQQQIKDSPQFNRKINTQISSFIGRLEKLIRTRGLDKSVTTYYSPRGKVIVESIW